MTRFEKAMLFLILIVVAVCFTLASLANAGEIDHPPAGYPDCANPPAHVYSLKFETPNDIYDGDTVSAYLCKRDVFRFIVSIDRGEVCSTQKETLRLYGHNAWEMTRDERPMGIKGRDWLRARLWGKAITAIPLTDKNGEDARGKYGRVLATLCDGPDDIATEMVAAGLTRWWEY